MRKASYGVPEDPQRTRDVTARVQSLIDGGADRVQVDQLAIPDDPAPNAVKTLTVDYAVNGRPSTVSGRDGQVVRFPEKATQIKVAKAAYGVLDDPKRTKDVREKLQRLFDAGETQIPVTRMAEDGDPAYMVVKTLQFNYTMEGQHRAYTGRDGDNIDLAIPEQAEPFAENPV